MGGKRPVKFYFAQRPSEAALTQNPLLIAPNSWRSTPSIPDPSEVRGCRTALPIKQGSILEEKGKDVPISNGR